MPLGETEAIVLRTYRLGEADKIASVLSRNFGRLRGVARGAQRPKSRYGSTLEPLTYIRLWFFERENRELVRMNSAEILESFFDMQKDYRVQLATQYLVETTERFLPEREVNERSFRLLLAVLRALKGSGEINRPLLYFNYWLLRLAGFLPNFEKCSACGRPLGDGAGYYGPGSEGLLCAACKQAGPIQRISVKVLMEAQESCGEPLERWLSSQKAAPGCREARHFFEELVQSHSEKPLLTRPLLADEV